MNELLSRGLMLKQKTKNRITFTPRIGQHFAYTPYLFVTKAKIKLERTEIDTLDNEKFTLTFSIVHWIPFVIAFIFTCLGYEGVNNPSTYVPTIILFAYITFITAMNYSIIKKLKIKLNE